VIQVWCLRPFPVEGFLGFFFFLNRLQNFLFHPKDSHESVPDLSHPPTTFLFSLVLHSGGFFPPFGVVDPSPPLPTEDGKKAFLRISFRSSDLADLLL